MREAQNNFMRTSIQIQNENGEGFRNVNIQDYFYGVTETLNANLETGDSMGTKNLILVMDLDLDDLKNFLERHPIPSEGLQEIVTELLEEGEDSW
jgi:hypothetical protein